jgi:hypothetical protein
MREETKRPDKVEETKDKGETLKLLEEKNMTEKNNKTKKVKWKMRKKTVIFLSPRSFIVQEIFTCVKLPNS